MATDLKYHYDERLIVRLAIVLIVIVGLLAMFLAQRLNDSEPVVSESVAPEEVWAYVQEQAMQAKLNPDFIYAIAWAESSLNPDARSSMARGMMQLSRAAWREVSDESYSQAWDWRTNIRVGISYLAFCRDFLVKRDAFNYPLVAACYRYGPYYVQNKKFKISAMKQPKNKIYQRLFLGNLQPIERPINLTVSQVR
ncbi:MAG: soluble lytic murein transglycosylase-like protein [Lentimonas sp.]|jgi:soluble lytic murein transglycosylase-like protein